MNTFKHKIESQYTIVESKISGLLEHPISERLQLLKKRKNIEGAATVIAYDLTEGVWTELFNLFSKVFLKYNIKLNPPIDKAPHITLAYVKNASEQEIEQIKTIVKNESIMPFVLKGVTFLVGKQNKKDIYVVLDFGVNSTYRKIYNSIMKLVGHDRLVEFRTFWKGHIPHASIGIVQIAEGTDSKKIEKELTSLVKTKNIKLIPKFVEVHKDTKLDNFTPELIDYVPLNED